MSTIESKARSTSGPRSEKVFQILRSNSCQSAGTPTMPVMWPVSSASLIASASISSMYVIDAPCTSGIRKPAENSNVWCSGSTDRRPSCAYSVKHADSFAAIAVKFLWLSITPLGWPVVPDVKITEAIVSPLTCAGTAPAETSGSVSSSSNASTSMTAPASAR